MENTTRSIVKKSSQLLIYFEIFYIKGSIKAHKVFLSVVSPVFKRMFCGPFRSAPSEENEAR